jgi:hypothetical protein
MESNDELRDGGREGRQLMNEKLRRTKGLAESMLFRRVSAIYYTYTSA